MYYFEYRYLHIWPVKDNLADTFAFRGPPEYSYPAVPEPVSSVSCALLVIFVPIIVIAVFQIRIRSFWDFHAGVFGSLKGIVAATFVCTVLKHFIGGFRPNYMHTCKPVLDRVAVPVEHHAYWFNPTACANARFINRSLQGFPSGHAGSAFASAIFLTLYLNAKLKVCSDHAPDFWALIITTTPLLGASLLSGSMYITHQHHAHEIIFGMMIGVLFGAVTFRTSYAAMFDFHYNHVPLPPSSTNTRLLYTKDSVLGSVPRGERGTQCDDLVMWKWWKLHGESRIVREKELAWFESIMSLRMTRQRLNPLVKNNKQGRMMSSPGEGLPIRSGHPRGVSCM
jgi:diacylglycerol diphosphate phosphatase/phosphatidate phosphatase